VARAAAPTAPVSPTDHVLKIAAAKSRAARSGAKGEQILEAYHRLAAACGISLQKVPTETRRVKQGRTWGLIYTRRSTVDFVGFRVGDGRHVAIECKTCTARPRFTLSEVEPHQRAYLDAVHEAGGIAALAVVWGPERHVSLYPWHVVREATSLGPATLQAWQTTPTQYAAELTEFEKYAAAKPFEGSTP